MRLSQRLHHFLLISYITITYCVKILCQSGSWFHFLEIQTTSIITPKSPMRNRFSLSAINQSIIFFTYAVYETYITTPFPYPHVILTKQNPILSALLCWKKRRVKPIINFVRIKGFIFVLWNRDSWWILIIVSSKIYYRCKRFE